MYYLSIISPFYNSENKSQRLLNTLNLIDDSGVEIILVDDGSKDNTLDILKNFKDNSQSSVKVICQNNKGPGGARNAGLKASNGKYVWFVDSDDNIRLDVLKIIKDYEVYDYDFIDFNYITNGISTNSMSVTPGSYSINNKNRIALLGNFGRICTKLIRKDFITSNNLYYPEYCVREDSPLTMIYPLVTHNFMRSDIDAYIHYEDYPSITRSKIDSYWFDRMHTAIFGYMKAREVVSTQADLDYINKKFMNLYLFMTIEGIVTKKPSYTWIITYKVMKKFREVAKNLDIDYQLVLPTGYSKQTKIWFVLQWYISYLIPLDTDKYFKEQRVKTWGKSFKYN